MTGDSDDLILRWHIDNTGTRKQQRLLLSYKGRWLQVGWVYRKKTGQRNQWRALLTIGEGEILVKMGSCASCQKHLVESVKEVLKDYEITNRE